MVSLTGYVSGFMGGTFCKTFNIEVQCLDAVRLKNLYLSYLAGPASRYRIWAPAQLRGREAKASQ